MKQYNSVSEMVMDITEDRELAASIVAKIEAKNSWLPIETAPRDGTAIIACSDYAVRLDLGAHPRSVSWRQFHPNQPGKGDWRNHLGHKEQFLTHWMPLPVPPPSDEYDPHAGGDEGHVG